METTLKILDYWYNLEFCVPFWPKQTKQTIYLGKKPKQSEDWINKKNSINSYDVYLGKITSQSLIKMMQKNIGQNETKTVKDYTQSCICAFKVSAEGMYVKGSFNISSFVWGISQIIIAKNMQTALKIDELDELNNELNRYLDALNEKLSYKDFEDIFYLLIERLKLKKLNLHFSAIINEDEENLYNTTDMIRSPYISDIDMIRKNVQVNDRIVTYIQALKSRENSRIEIDRDILEMKKWISIEKYPLGKWPSANSPSLMQQLAINLAISDNAHEANIFSVNGPPGTGKTTLLKEIIAHTIVDRASHLITFQNPDDAFTIEKFIDQENEELKHFYSMDLNLKKHGILVASNNNAAVENISKELPLAKDVKKTNTTLFNIDGNKDIYFAKIASALLNEESWGLISVRLGKKSNIDEFKTALWSNEDSENLQQIYNKDIPDWQEAKDNFVNKYNEVLKHRQSIEEAIGNISRYKLLAKEIKLDKKELEILKSKMLDLEIAIKQKKQELISTEKKIKILEANEKVLLKLIPWYKMLFSFFFNSNKILNEYRKTKEKINDETIHLTGLSESINELELQLDNQNKYYQKSEQDFEEKNKELQQSSELIKQYKVHFGNNFAEYDFWENIQINEKSQLSTPWTDKTFDTLREELFYYGLMLQKAFVLNSNAVKQNINCLINMWDGKSTEKDKRLGYNHLLNTLFLVVPVISTTFASVSSFLCNIEKNGLGTLIIDEAGQATPNSALGAIWRTNKAIIVGDPLQVEPISSISEELLNRFAEELKIAKEYRAQELSVQLLADNLNQFGGYREYLNNRLWLGCPLVVHRRCLNPMFSISNQIAYNSRMFKQTTEPKKDVELLLEKSKWIDIKGKEVGEKDHYVPEQGDMVIDMVLMAFKIQKGFPSLYIISPFKSVVLSLRRELKFILDKNWGYLGEDNIIKWVDDSCGTVHTFQGKEANEVLFVLGCDTKSGCKAAKWAGKKPNILNVAVTRAKYRIAIIGDSDLWRKVPYYNEAFKVLSK